VHHCDRDRSNRKPENLEIICPTCHAEEHYYAKDGMFGKNKYKVVDLVGSAPTASCVQNRRSPE
jgi:5-methylcytosine-specific restriction endonuclease McrA